ncbi:MAG: sigma-70 family RNA polymerase sigma factor [Planctomycetaceae bacterium]|nr:sigma-70 family RNA polymerase sigma factor [Planctomycetaceae bacterium]
MSKKFEDRVERFAGVLRYVIQKRLSALRMHDQSGYRTGHTSDLLQNTFEGLLRQKDQLDEMVTADFERYAMRSAANETLKLLRELHYSRRAVRELSATIRTAEETPSDSVDAGYFVDRCSALLGVDDFQTLMMTLSGYTLHEIAEATNTTRRSVQLSLLRSKKVLSTLRSQHHERRTQCSADPR